MSSNVTSPSQQKASGDVTSSPSGLKAKTKAKDKAKEDNHQEQDDDDDDDDEDDEDDDEMGSEEEEDDEEEDQLEAIDTTAIQSSRTRGIRVDYTSKEALAKAGLAQDVDDDDEDEAMKE